jgi:hypothetical protein
VKWLGYPFSKCTWEPAANLPEDVVEAYDPFVDHDGETKKNEQRERERERERKRRRKKREKQRPKLTIHSISNNLQLLLFALSSSLFIWGSHPHR